MISIVKTTKKPRINQFVRWTSVFDAKRDNEGKGISIDKLIAAVRRTLQ